MTTFISVGNATQPFGRLLDAVAVLAPRLPGPVVVQHGATPFASPDCEARPFVSMSEFEALVARARLLILHAGAGSVIHAVRAGKLPVVMPRRVAHGEHVDDHQLEFAIELERAGKIVVAREGADLPGAIERALAQGDAVRSAGAQSEMTRLVAELLQGVAGREGR